ncbi:MAG: hypothetical protein RIQ52_1976 [Pseudomonadota bacterium]|jgi:hypothetical protein
MNPRHFIRITMTLALTAANTAMAEQPQDFINGYTQEAKAQNPGFSGFDAARGQQLFTAAHATDWRCTTCHTDNPKAQGKHAETQKVIEPLAPSANPARFTNREKVEKWFKRSCKDVLERECTAQEKGDVLTWLLSLP